MAVLLAATANRKRTRVVGSIVPYAWKSPGKLLRNRGSPSDRFPGERVNKAAAQARTTLSGEHPFQCQITTEFSRKPDRQQIVRLAVFARTGRERGALHVVCNPE